MLIRLIFLAFSLFTASSWSAEPLPPEQAFQFSARAFDGATIEARWQIADGYYLYRDKIKLSATDGELGVTVLPAGKFKEDETFGKVEIYRNEIVARVPVTKSAGTLHLRAQYQGCWDGGICYPPQIREVTIDLASASPVAPRAASNPSSPATPTSGSPSSEDSSAIAQLLGKTSHDGSYLLMLTSFFGFGLLLAFTPCMFPMIPILSAIIVQHGHAVTHRRAFVLSLAYVLGMALTYALVGVLAGLTGTLLSTALQNVWVLGAFALVFVILALSMFGLYELQLPSALQSRISDSANRRGGSLGAIASMGALSALIVGPCVAAPLAGALLFIAKTGNALLGGTALFIMALGMGAPLLVVGAFSRGLLPKSGPWMTGVNRFFGVLMLATALWLISALIPIWLSMLGWSLLLIVPAVFLHALDPLPAQAHAWQRLAKGLGVALLLSGAAMLAGVLGGARDPLRPLEFLSASNAALRSGAVSPAPTFRLVASVAELDAQVLGSPQPVMLDFYADWCVSCKEMVRETFSDPTVAAHMANFNLLKADVTENTAADKGLLARFGLFGPPGIVFFDASGKELAAPRVTGFVPPERFLATLKQALAGG